MFASLRRGLLALWLAASLGAGGCGRIGFQEVALSDDGGPRDGRVDSADGEVPGDGGMDSGAGLDANVEAGIDAGPLGPVGQGIDAGTDSGMGADAGTDSGMGADAGTDSGMGVDAGTDSGTGGLNLPPVARFFVEPSAGTPSTLFEFDASASSDAEDAPASLSYAWDWDADGVLDASGAVTTHSFATAGHQVVWLAVDDSSGLRSWASVEVVVVALASDLILVTTALDEANASANPGAPGGNGLSLREAITYAEATAGKQTILVPSGMAITLTLGAIGMGGSNTEIVGDGAILVGMASVTCFEMTGDGNFIAGLEITGCGTQPVRILGTGNQLTRVHAHDNGDGVVVLSDGNTIGPGNEIDHNTTHGIDVFGTTIVIGNSIHHNTGSGMFLNMVADGSTVVGNFVYANQDRGLLLGTGLVNPVIAHNTVDSNVMGGVLCSNTLTGLSFRNNIVARNQGWGLDCTDSNITALSHVDYYQNTLGSCTSCSTLGPSALAVNPGYIDAVGFDLRLLSSSMLIDAAIDLGYDRNGLSPGLFDGTAPDIGANEAPQ